MFKILVILFIVKLCARNNIFEIGLVAYFGPAPTINYCLNDKNSLNYIYELYYIY